VMYQKVKLETSLNIWTVSLRGDYKIFRKWYLPFFSVELQANYFQKRKIKTDLEHDSSELIGIPWWENDQFDIAGMRLGTAICAGYEVVIFKKTALALQVNYSVLNFLGKKDTEKMVDAIKLSLILWYKK